MNPAQRRQAALITVAAVALLAVLHGLPRDTRLSHMDFVPAGEQALEFCDPTNPRFLPVVARPGAVTLALAAEPPARAGAPTTVALSLRTATGRPIGPADLRPTAGESLQLQIVDAALDDYQHVVPRPQAQHGEWRFAFTPRRGGLYRVFADLTPRATGQEVYVSAALPVGAGPSGPAVAMPAQAFSREGCRFTLTASTRPIYARQPLVLSLEIERIGGGMVPIVPEDGAFAHLVAFDPARTGFFDLTPPPGGPPPNPFHPQREFKGTFSEPGKYVLWCRVNLGGREVSGPFGIEVIP